MSIHVLLKHKVLLLRLRDFTNNFMANKNVKACIEGQELVQGGVLCFKEHHVRFVTRDYNFTVFSTQGSRIIIGPSCTCSSS
jgi:hypothetical protein